MLDNLCIQHFSSLSRSDCPDLVSGGDRIKLRIDIIKPGWAVAGAFVEMSGDHRITVMLDVVMVIIEPC